MRKLLNTLYINNTDYYLSTENNNVVVSNDTKILLKIPFCNLESIITTSYKGASMKLMYECINNGVYLSFVTEYGKYLGTFVGETKGNILLRKEQYRISDSKEKSLIYSKIFVIAKILNCRSLLMRFIREHSSTKEVSCIIDVKNKLLDIVKKIENINTIEDLRIQEGVAAQYYFSQFNYLILQQKDIFKFTNRNRQPPMDKINALLSFAYTLLAHDCRGALETVGLDSYCGFMHTDRPGRCSLALDIMEELRSIVADRFVLKLINNKIITNADFTVQVNGAVFLNEQGRKKFLTHWETNKKETIIHPFLKEKIEWGLIPYSQALLLSRTIRGDLEKYPPFFWK